MNGLSGAAAEAEMQGKAGPKSLVDCHDPDAA